LTEIVLPLSKFVSGTFSLMLWEKNTSQRLYPVTINPFYDEEKCETSFMWNVPKDLPVASYCLEFTAPDKEPVLSQPFVITSKLGLA